MCLCMKRNQGFLVLKVLWKLKPIYVGSCGLDLQPVLFLIHAELFQLLDSFSDGIIC